MQKRKVRSKIGNMKTSNQYLIKTNNIKNLLNTSFDESNQNNIHIAMNSNNNNDKNN